MPQRAGARSVAVVIPLYVAILVSPLVIGCAIAASQRARSFIGAHFATCMVAGWSAVLILIPAALLLKGGARTAVLAVVCPLMALSFWRRNDGGDDGGGGGGDDPDPSLPDPPQVDWERFMRDLDEYAASRF